MRHGYKKIRFKAGKDAYQMLVRTLAINFLAHGKMETTHKRAKVIKTYIEKLVEKSKEKTEANKNCLLKAFGNDKKTIAFLFNQVGPVMKDKIGGYVRVVKLKQRLSDGSLVCRLEWVYPVVKK
jgi:large subunit ribosomal protein L17